MGQIFKNEGTPMGAAVNFAAVGHDVYLDVPLSNVAIQHRPMGMIADKIFPLLTVRKQSGSVIEGNREDALRRDDTKRAPGTPAKMVTRDVSSHLYYCHNYALGSGVTIEDRANAEPPYVQMLFNEEVQFVKDKLMLDQEIRVASQVTSTSNVGSSSAVTSGWGGAGDPLGDVNAAIDNILDTTGIRPNNISFGEAGWRTFRRDTTVRNLIKGVNNGGGYVSVAEVSKLLEIENINIGGMFQNTGGEGLAEALSQVWGDNVLVSYAPRVVTRRAPTMGFLVRLNAPGIPNMQVERYPYSPQTKMNGFDLSYYQDEFLVNSGYSFLLTAVNSST